MLTPRFVSVESPTARRSVTGLYPCRGLYWAPDGAAPRTAFLITHYDEDLSEHYLASTLASRGYGVLGWNTRYQGQAQHFSLPHALVDVGAGVRWLRDTAGVEHVVLLGNSGGGSLSVIYQAEAGSPTGILKEVWDSTAETPAASGLVTLNAHVGRPEWLTSMLDPSVQDETDPVGVDPALDLFAPGRPLPLETEFVASYRAAQRARNQRIGHWVDEEQDRLRDNGARDRLFVVHRVWADPRFVDLTIDPSRREPGCFLGDARKANAGVHGAARICTLRSWREMWDLDTGRCTASAHWDRVSAPAMVIQALADQGVFPSDAHAIHDGLGSPDKRLEFVEGDHFLRAAEAKEHVADLLDDWVQERW